MDKKLIVGIDCDGVLANFTKKARDLHNHLHDNRIDPAWVQTGWGFDSLGVTKEQEKMMWKVVDATPNWWMDLDVMPGTSRLAEFVQKHNVYFITNRKDGTGLSVKDQTSIWLAHNFGIPYPSVIVSDSKGPVAKGLKLDYFIDDRPKNCFEVELESPSTKVYLYDATYNTEVPMTRMPRVGSVDRLIEIIEVPLIEPDKAVNRPIPCSWSR